MVQTTFYSVSESHCLIENSTCNAFLNNMSFCLGCVEYSFATYARRQTYHAEALASVLEDFETLGTYNDHAPPQTHTLVIQNMEKP